MRKKTHEILLARFIEATGRSDCTEVVVIQRRPRWAMPLTAGLVVVALLLTRVFFDPGTLVRGLIVGAVVGLSLTFLMTGHWLARCGESAVLVQTGRGLSGPHVTIAEWPIPVEASIGNGFGTKRVTLDGESYVLAATMLSEFRSITGSATI